jgi:hypothetical protein
MMLRRGNWGGHGFWRSDGREPFRPDRKSKFGGLRTGRSGAESRDLLWAAQPASGCLVPYGTSATCPVCEDAGFRAPNFIFPPALVLDLFPFPPALRKPSRASFVCRGLLASMYSTVSPQLLFTSTGRCSQELHRRCKGDLTPEHETRDKTL